MHGTRPSTIGMCVQSSPVALLAWRESSLPTLRAALTSGQWVRSSSPGRTRRPRSTRSSRSSRSGGSTRRFPRPSMPIVKYVPPLLDPADPHSSQPAPVRGTNDPTSTSPSPLASPRSRTRSRLHPRAGQRRRATSSSIATISAEDTLRRWNVRRRSRRTCRIASGNCGPCVRSGGWNGLEIRGVEIERWGDKIPSVSLRPPSPRQRARAAYSGAQAIEGEHDRT